VSHKCLTPFAPKMVAYDGNKVVTLELINTKTLEPEAAAPAAVAIRLSNISKFYSSVPALENVSVEFREGEVHAVLGENGAGKSTLMNIISGTLHPEVGDIDVNGVRIPAMTPEIAASLGISISFQHPAVLDDLSVLENLQVALPARLFKGKSAQGVARQAMDAVGLHVPLRTRADALTVAQKHLLELAKALAINPRVLILDEPTASLDQAATDMLFGRIKDAVSTGTAVIYITHRLAEVRQIADRVTVLRDGRFRGTSLVSAISDADVLALIVGRTLGSAFPPKSQDSSQDKNFAVEALSGAKFKDVSFEVSRGQIIGVAGVSGNGQSELMRALAGLTSSKGTIHLNGRSLNHRDLLHEVAFMPSDRHTEGLAGSLTVRENATFAALEKFASFGVLSRKKELEQVATTFKSLAVKAPSIECRSRA
jgi:ribose transport system ATP-binding protein